MSCATHQSGPFSGAVSPESYVVCHRPARTGPQLASNRTKIIIARCIARDPLPFWVTSRVGHVQRHAGSKPSMTNWKATWPANSSSSGAASSFLKTFALGRHQRHPPRNLIRSPASHRMPIRPRLQHRPRLVAAHVLRITATRAERAAIRRIERVGQIAPCRRQRRVMQRIGDRRDQGLRIGVRRAVRKSRASRRSRRCGRDTSRRPGRSCARRRRGRG